MKSIEAIYEHGSFKPLQPVDLEDGEKVFLSIERATLSQAEAVKQLLEWHKVYEGLSEDEIVEMENLMLDRNHFSDHKE